MELKRPLTDECLRCGRHRRWPSFSQREKEVPLSVWMDLEDMLSEESLILFVWNPKMLNL